MSTLTLTFDYIFQQQINFELRNYINNVHNYLKIFLFDCLANNNNKSRMTINS